MAKLRENFEHLKHMLLGAGFSLGPLPVREREAEAA